MRYKVNALLCGKVCSGVPPDISDTFFMEITQTMVFLFAMTKSLITTPTDMQTSFELRLAMLRSQQVQTYKDN